jgi:hypothetical protein
MFASHCEVFLSLLLLAALRYVSASQGESSFYIVYGSPGGQYVAGLYGGMYKPGEPSSNINLRQTRVYRAIYGTYFGVDGFSYDPVSKKALVLFDNSLAIIDPCQNEELTCEELYFTQISRHLRTGPFAIYASKVYFLAKQGHVKGNSVVATLSIRQLRKGSGCEAGETSFVSRDGSDNRNCSVEVAKVLEETIFTHSRPLSESSVRDFLEYAATVGSKLEVIKKEDKLHFLVQIAKPLYPTGKYKFNK